MKKNTQKKEPKKVSLERPPLLVFLFFVFIIASPFYINSDKRQTIKAKYSSTNFSSIPVEEINLEFIKEIPDGKKNGRCKQPTIEQLHMIGQSKKYQLVIRTNGNGKDSGGVPLSVQDSILRGYGMRMVFINAHLPKSPENVHAILKEHEGIIIHCLYGFDRTGGLVGYHLRKQGFSIEDVLEHNDWEDYLDSKGFDYYQYFKMIL